MFLLPSSYTGEQMPTIQGIFTVGGIPRDGATVKLWSEGAFSSPPERNDTIPSGSPVTSGTTGPESGCNGGYRFTGVASGAYYASVEWNGLTVYQYHLIQDGTGLGVTLAQDYANLQEAIDATPSGGTLYIPAGDYTTTTGFVVSGKPINIHGSGRGTRLIPAASGITVLSLVSPEGATTTRFQFCEVRDFSVINTDNHASCTLLLLDRARRNSFHNLNIDDGSKSNGGTGINIKSSWILSFSNCLIQNCQLGMDTRTIYGTDGGATTSIMYQGGMIEACTSGVILSATSMCTFRTVIEASTSVGIYASGAFQTVCDGCYWENAAPAYDVVLDGCKATRLENVDRVNLLGIGNGLIIHGMRDIADNVIDGGTNWVDIQFGPLWASESGAGNTDLQTDYYALWKQGKMAMVGNIEAKTHVTPESMRGENLLQNYSGYDSHDGWTLVNCASVTSGLPFGATRVIASTSGLASGTVVSGSCPTNITPDTSIGDTMCCVGCFIKIPDETWLNWRVYLLDGSRNGSKTIPDSLKTGDWEFAVAPLRLGSSPTQLTFLVSGNAGASGQVFISRPFLCLGTSAHAPPVAEHLLPARVHYPRVQTPAAANKVSLSTSGQIDPTIKGGRMFVEGDGAAVTGTTGQALFSANPDGMRLTLIGSSSTWPVTLVSGGNTKLDLGAATRVLSSKSILQLEYDDFFGVWHELGFKA